MLNCFRTKSKKKDKCKNGDNGATSPVDGGAPVVGEQQAENDIQSQGPTVNGTHDTESAETGKQATETQPLLTNGTSEHESNNQVGITKRFSIRWFDCTSWL